MPGASLIVGSAALSARWPQSTVSLLACVMRARTSPSGCTYASVLSPSRDGSLMHPVQLIFVTQNPTEWSTVTAGEVDS
jgi:hypothetical protein